jgi:predicted nuclease of restriction endonuclease-like (RecB) superfamily
MDETSEPREQIQAKPLLFDELRGLILGARERVARAVNKELVLLYWSVGRRIREDLLGADRAKYGEGIVSTLSRQLAAEFGTGFSRPNLFSMLRFAELWANEDAVVKLADRLSWSHFRELLSIEQPLRREFYVEMCAREGWSVRTLRNRLQGMMYERTLVSQQPEGVIRQELARLREEDRMSPDLVFRDPYLLDFLGLADTYSERDFESAILKELERFLLELGGDFSFVARQKRMSIGAQDFYLDLLFYHRSLQRLVAIELKLGRFEAAFKGQMELYLRWLEKYERKEAEESPLGLILCSEKDHEQIELLELNKGEIRVAEYLLQLPERQLLEAKLADAVRRAEESVRQKLESESG